MSSLTIIIIALLLILISLPVVFHWHLITMLERGVIGTIHLGPGPAPKVGEEIYVAFFDKSGDLIECLNVDFSFLTYLHVSDGLAFKNSKGGPTYAGRTNDETE